MFSALGIFTTEVANIKKLLLYLTIYQRELLRISYLVE